MANPAKVCDCLKDTNDFHDKLNRDRKERVLTDFHVQSGPHSDHKMPCHKIVLKNRTGLSSDVTTLAIKRDLRPSTPAIDLPSFLPGVSLSVQSGEFIRCEFDVPKDALDAVLQFVYTFRVEVTEDNVFHLYQLAEKLCIESLYQFCLDFINNLVVTDLNWATFCHYQEKLGFSTLRQKVAIHLATNFAEKQHDELLMHISNDFLQVVLSRDDLMINDETEVFCFIQKWIRHERHGDSTYDDPVEMWRGVTLLRSHCFMDTRIIRQMKDEEEKEQQEQLAQLAAKDGSSAQKQQEKKPAPSKEDERSVFAPELLRLVRLPMIRDIVREHREMRLIEEFRSPECNMLFDMATDYRSIPSTRWSSQSPMTRPRPSTGFVETLIAVTPQGQELLSFWDEGQQRWLPSRCEQPSTMQFRNSLSISVVCHDDKFYVIDTEKTSVHVCENIRSNTWRQIPSRFESRGGAACVIENDSIYIIGGKHNHKLTKTVERMDIPKQKWMQVNGDFSEYIPVSSPCLFSLLDKIYVIGGRDENDKKVRHAQVFDRKRAKWWVTKDLFPEDFNAITAACYDGVVYILGDSGKMVAYNVGSLELTQSADFGLDSARASMTVYQKHAVALQPGEKKLLFFDPETSKTKETPSHIDTGKSVYLFTLSLPCEQAVESLPEETTMDDSYDTQISLPDATQINLQNAVESKELTESRVYSWKGGWYLMLKERSLYIWNATVGIRLFDDSNGWFDFSYGGNKITIWSSGCFNVYEDSGRLGGEFDQLKRLAFSQKTDMQVIMQKPSEQRIPFGTWVIRSVTEGQLKIIYEDDGEEPQAVVLTKDNSGFTFESNRSTTHNFPDEIQTEI